MTGPQAAPYFPPPEEGGPNLEDYQATPHPMGPGVRVVWFVKGDESTRLGETALWGEVVRLVLQHHNGVQED